MARTNTTISSGQVRDDAVIQKLRDKLADLESCKLEAQSEYTDRYPRPVARLDDQIGAVRKQLDEEVRRLVRGGSGDLSLQQSLSGRAGRDRGGGESHPSTRGQVVAELGQVEGQLQRIPGPQLVLANLQRDQDVAAGIYSDLLKQAQEVEVGRIMALGNAEVAESATRPLAPTKPSVFAELGVGSVVGTGRGPRVGADPGPVGRFRAGPGGGLAAGGRADSRHHSCLPRSGTAMWHRSRAPMPRPLEAYRALRYCLDFVTPGERGKALLVTSGGAARGQIHDRAQPGDGGVTDGTAGGAGRYRPPPLGPPSHVGGGGGVGITDVLLGQATLEEALQRDREERPHGPRPPYPRRSHRNCSTSRRRCVSCSKSCERRPTW